MRQGIARALVVGCGDIGREVAVRLGLGFGVSVAGKDLLVDAEMKLAMNRKYGLIGGQILHGPWLLCQW